MSQSVSLWGATYSNVPALTVPKSGGGTARFDDCSVVTATAADVASGKIFVAADGTITTGTASGGVDIPTFDVAWDAHYTTRTVTCDETFAECFQRFVNGDYGAYVFIHDDFGWEEKQVATAVDAVGSSHIAYVVDGAYGPVYDIMYYPDGTISIVEPSAYATALVATANGEYYPTKGVYSNVTVNVPGSGGTYQSKTRTYTPSETAQSETVTADSGYDALSSVSVSVGAISSTYVGSGITRRSSSDLTASGATVTVPAGYYSAQATKSVTSGTAGTPAATKGAVSNHSVSVTPSVTNTAGYISGGTKTGTAVTVSASELVSGSETKTANGTYDVTNLAELVVNVSGGSSMNVQVAQSTTRASSSTYTSLVSLTCSTAGTYDIYWSCFRSSTSGTSGSQLYVGGSAYGTANTAFTNHIQNNHLTGVTLAKNQTVAVYARSRGSNYYAYVGTLTIKQTA